MIRQIEKLRREHAVEAFDCGDAELNRFLQQHALQNQRSGAAQTYVGLVDSTVVGYYALAVGSVEQEAAPGRVRKGLAR
ncbi:MAG: GNAT family N-acetyltransferase, partial [Nitrospiraceae bacterium]